MKKVGQRCVFSLAVFGATLIGVALAVSTAQAEDPPFYKGKQIRLIIASDVAGGYDTYGRLFARHISKFIPGHPTVVVTNMDGGGGVMAANYLSHVAPKDGTVLVLMQNNMPQAKILGLQGVDFDPTQLNWLGSLNSEVSVCVAWHTSPVKTIEDAKTSELIVGGSGQNNTEQLPAVFNNLVGTKFKIISGYPGGAGILLAMERGEVEGRCGWSWSSVVVQRPQWLKDKKINVLAQVALKKHPDLPDVPLVYDLAKTEEDRQALDFLFARLSMGRPIAAPPGMPPERVALLRKAFDEMVADKEVQADFENQKQELTQMSGKEVQALVERLNKFPPDVKVRADAATEYRGVRIRSGGQ